MTPPIHQKVINLSRYIQKTFIFRQKRAQLEVKFITG